MLEEIVAAESKEKAKKKEGKGGIVVKGIHDVAVRFSKCCNPVPGDEIVGFVTRGRGISIHRTDCVNIINFPANERRVDFNKGYSFLFERCFEENTLEEIEKIDWSHVTVKTLDANYPPCGLPEGYSFVVKDIQYIKCYDSFEVTIEVDKQYWGDVTPYQAQIAELTAASEAKDSELSEKNALIAEKAQQIAQKDSKIA